MTNLQSLSFYYPELILIGVILVAIIYDLSIDKSKSGNVGWFLVAGLLAVAGAIYLQENTLTTLFTNAIVLDPFASFFKLIIILATIFVSIVSLQSGELNDYRKGEYFTLLGIIVFGLFLMVSTVDLIMVYLSIEIVSIMSFILAGYLKQNTRSNEAGLKYVVYGAFSSGIMLFGLSYVYGLTGSTNYFEIQHAISNLDSGANTALLMAMIMLLVGFGYKISAVPFHFWTPDVYEGAPTTITAFLSVAPKAGAFAMIIRFFNQVFADGGAMGGLNETSIATLPWATILSLLAIITMTLGNVVAVQQNNIKRMLAYSSIAHAGYMLLAMPVMSGDSIYAIMIYLVMYLFMNLGAFFVVITVKNTTGGETFDDYKGLGWKMPIVGVVMTLFMVSLTGLPPTAGFIGKFYIFASLIKGGSQFYWLVFIGGINSVVSLYYYMRVIKVMFLDGERSERFTQPPTIMTIMLLVTAIPTFLLGIYWTPVSDWVQNSLVFFIQTM
ncbi:MAG: NADH-quinone oxidoreductase subunit N [Candidatus Marinimicrobia bacterium]|jgi:NADH-quinone oxidoreductase subunit N|nr:NADH-quinone oxidoreductase subunit N [Candidatus Neomarinimicrobiota bacterium]MBT3501853.1 NADH-quinone oxidoreductase subunit N [Candidatus Neomarinimicrobiota bacterium]MBT3838621.1 NADH-quinone oxidoreductase subunit N [Candidatus Neomarinimicrobiota bacterium]MBT3999765.1 NADH-quinone oxidoreductase subunit N [Candidatus Neomarinimicrobiota bacterium]MBT4578634.1 NADH-quinone oxidoreductase subunit N [Candidatus Neomarinimicrobiota bacterium]